MQSLSKTRDPLLEIAGAQESELAANKTLVLDSKSQLLVVTEGKVLAFAVELVDGQPLGKRYLLATLEPGDLVMGVESTPASAMKLMVTGVGQAQIVTLELDNLRALFGAGAKGTGANSQDTGTKDPGANSQDTGAKDTDANSQDDLRTSELIEAIERWITLTTQTIVHGTLPKGLKALDSYESQDLDETSTICPADGVVWAKCLAGSIFIANCEETLVSATDGIIPVADTGWLSAFESATVEFARTDAVLADQSVWQALEVYNRAVIDVMARRAGTEMQFREMSTRDAITRDARQTEHAIKDLADVLPSHKREVPRSTENPLEEVVKIIEDELGVSPLEEAALFSPGQSGEAEVVSRLDSGDGSTIKKRIDSDKAELIAYAELLNRLRHMAQRSGCRARRASLAPKWWEQDSGPLIGFLAKDWSPVALVRSGSSYNLFNPALGTKVRVDETLANTLRVEAVAFSRGLASELHRASTLIRHAIKGSGIDFTKVIIFGSLAGLASLVVPLATGLVFNTIVPNSERHRLVVLIVVLVMVALGVGVGSLARGVAFVRARARTTASAQMSVWDRLLKLPASFFSEYAVGDLMSRTQSIQLSQQILTDAVVANLLNGIFGIFNLVLLFKGGGTLFIIGLLLLIIQFAITVWINLIASTPSFLRQLQAQNFTQSLTLQMVRGVNKLRVAAAESRAFAVWAHRFSVQQKATYHQGKLRAINGVFTASWQTLTSLAIIGGVLMTGSGHLSLGNYIAYTTAFTQGSVALITIGAGLSVMSTSLSYLEQLHPILQATPEVGMGQTDPGELQGKVTVAQVEFRYEPDRPLVLRGVTIRANPGEFIAIVGPSGAGKSSIMRLLLGFDTPESGVIAFDDKDLALLDSTSVRRQIGSVIQGAQLLPGTIFSNIAGGLPITRDEAWDAAKAAGMDEDIADMPMGMETVVQEGGGTLSGGQRQRLLIARSLALKPKILFFDEATSALDNITQAQVTASINQLQVTRIVIAHRLSTIKDADRIYVLVAGQIAQEGSYDELMAVEGPFMDLAKRQIA